MKTKDILILGALGFLLFNLYTKSKADQAVADQTVQEQQEIQIIREGQIIALDTQIFGECDTNTTNTNTNTNTNECMIGKQLMIHSTFKNIGDYDKANKVAILVDNRVVEEKYITLCPYQEYLLSYNLVLTEERPYEICGTVFPVM